MAIDRTLRGVYVPLVTPFATDGSVAIDALEGLSHHYLDAGVAGLVPLGTTGEAPAARRRRRSARSSTSWRAVCRAT